MVDSPQLETCDGITSMTDSSRHSMLRLISKLEHALGPDLCRVIDEPDVIEVMLNPDGKLFIERQDGSINTLGDMVVSAAETVIGCVAHVLGVEVGTSRPIISGELPIGGHRFEGLLPPVVTAPIFSIRRRASRLVTLDEYVRSRNITPWQADIIREAVARRANIVVAGGTGSGKTTLANAILAETVACSPKDRLIILEDTAEIRCAGDNVVSLHTSETVDMSRLLKSTMRLRHDRIIVGEVRDGAALTLLKAWNTGHPGGIATVHANSARMALRRLEQLAAEASPQPMQAVIGDAVDLIIAIQRTPTGRRVSEILSVAGFSDGHYHIEARENETRHAA